ncbi:MAG: C39 family peptidase [Ruminococcus sp.]|nr:C39 family peptidase [Ruminococcus sp.]
MKKIKLSVMSTITLLRLCSCSNYETIETMFMESEISFYDYEEYTEPITEPATYKIPDISEIMRTKPSVTAEPVEFTEILSEYTETSLSEETKTTATTTTVVSEEDFVYIDVPYISQNDEYPTGCELVSASMLLNFYGFDITAGELIDKGYINQAKLEHDDENKIYCADPNESFIGDPRTESGYGCYAPALLDGLKKYLDDKYFDAVNLSGISLHDLCIEYIDFGEPVIIWASVDMIATVVIENAWTIRETGDKFNWISNEHCLVLVGYDDNNYYFNDPQKGAVVPYKKETAEKRYKELGSQAVTIRPW